MNDPLEKRLEGDDGDRTGCKEVMSKMIETAKEEIKAGYMLCSTYVRFVFTVEGGETT